MTNPNGGCTNSWDLPGNEPMNTDAQRPFIIPVFLLMLKKISSPGQLFLYVLAWFLIFVVPTFDCYPFSYHRLLGLLICYVLQWQISGSKRDAPGIMEMGNKWISSLAGLSKG